MKTRKLILLSLGIILIYGCNPSNKKIVSNFENPWDSVKTSTDHKTYLKFMINNTESPNFDSAVSKYFKYKQAFIDSIGTLEWDCFGNCINIILKGSDTVLFEHIPIKIDVLNEYGLLYLINKNKNCELTEQIIIEDNEGKKRTISDGFFYIQVKKNSYSGLTQSIKEIKIAYEKYKNHLSNTWYNLDFDKLETDKKDYINKIVELRIIIDKYLEIEELNTVEFLN